MMRKLLPIVIALLLMAGMALAEEDLLYVRKVDGLPDDFMLGMDVSSVIAL